MPCPMLAAHPPRASSQGVLVSPKASPGPGVQLLGRGHGVGTAAGPFTSPLPRRIQHPNIVALDDIYESGSHLYLIMQL